MGKIITIGREFGSGGRELGRRLAEELHYEYYDKEILLRIAEHTSLSEEYVKQVVEHTPHHLYPITTGHSLSYINDYAFRQVQSVYQAQSEIICNLASRSDCVIVGRCAGYILRDRNPFRIFVYADLDSRVRRCLLRTPEQEHLTEKQLRRHILKIDRERARYYNFYTDQKWGDRRYYDLCINTTDTDIRDIIPSLARLFSAEHPAPRGEEK